MSTSTYHASPADRQFERIEADAVGILEGIMRRQNYPSATRDAIAKRISDVVTREIRIATGKAGNGVADIERRILAAFHHRTRTLFVPMTADDIRTRLETSEPIEKALRSLAVKGLIEVKDSAGPHAPPAIYTITSAGKAALK